MEYLIIIYLIHFLYRKSKVQRQIRAEEIAFDDINSIICDIPTSLHVWRQIRYQLKLFN